MSDRYPSPYGSGGKLARSRTNRVLGGVCGGVARYFGWDPTIVRLLTVLIAVVTAVMPCLIVYGILWLVMPED